MKRARLGFFLALATLAAGASLGPFEIGAWQGDQDGRLAPDSMQALRSAPEPEHPGDLAVQGRRALSLDAPHSPAGQEQLDDLAARVEGVADDPRWRRARLGILAVDGESGETLYALDAGVTMAPASNMKILTTAAALHLLGPDYRWMTWVTTEAPITDGVVHGDVLLYGTGDPTLDHGTARNPGAFDGLAAELLARGIRRIEGRVLGDGSYFSGPERLDAWDPRDLNDWFAAASPALSYNENVVQLRVEAGLSGEAPTVHSDPPHGGFALDNRATTVSARPRGRIHVLRDSTHHPIRVEGEIARGGRDVYRTITVQDPVLFAAHGFQAALETAGIVVTGTPGSIRDRGESPLSGARVFTGGSHRVLARHRSPPLLDALAVVNLESHNLYADLVLKTLGRVLEGEGSFAAGARIIERFAVDEVGVAEGSLQILDGSGLAADNLVTASALVAVLRHALASPYGVDFLETLPEAGTRQLRRMTRTSAARNLRAKTGTIEGVSALSGLVHSADGRPIVFSIIGNELSSAWGAKRLEDELGQVFASWSFDGVD
jgi:D-alanyl-D-alanine carboxypeptidase/D-alanyl-D-alanine-endopeptidase (penicillin-binding protein 4)